MKKRLTSVFFAVMLLISCSLEVFASSGENNINATLLERGFPQIVLDRLTESAKLDLYNDSSLRFSSAEITTFSEDFNESSTISVASDGSCVMPRDILPSANLEQTWVVAQAITYVNGVEHLDYFTVLLNYDWKTTPTEVFQDNMAISWDDDLFRMVPNSFYCYNECDTFLYGLDYVNYADDVHAGSTPSGVAWYAVLFNGGYAWNYCGYGRVQIEPKTTNIARAGNSVLYSKYVHNMSSLGASITVLGFADFSVSVPASTTILEQGSEIGVTWVTHNP